MLNVTPSPKLRAEAYNNLALIDRELGDNASARDKFQQAVNLSPRYVDAWVGLGLAAQKMRDYLSWLSRHFPGPWKSRGRISVTSCSPVPWNKAAARKKQKQPLSKPGVCRRTSRRPSEPPTAFSRNSLLWI